MRTMDNEQIVKRHGTDLCVSCNAKPIHIVKSGLCKTCYQRARAKDLKSGGGRPQIGPICINERQLVYASAHLSRGWIYRPATFRTEVGAYTPDFYDPERKAFVELVATRQDYEAQKPRYVSLRKLYPGIRHIVVTTLNQEIDISQPVKWPGK